MIGATTSARVHAQIGRSSESSFADWAARANTATATDGLRTGRRGLSSAGSRAGSRRVPSSANARIRYCVRHRGGAGGGCRSTKFARDDRLRARRCIGAPRDVRRGAARGPQACRHRIRRGRSPTGFARCRSRRVRRGPAPADETRWFFIRPARQADRRELDTKVTVGAARAHRRGCNSVTALAVAEPRYHMNGLSRTMFVLARAPPRC